VDRVRCYIDGFNLYHAIDELRQDHLKWVNYWKLAEQFIDPTQHRLEAVNYFSAFATWLPEPYRRHRELVAALVSVGVTPVMGKFYDKPRECRKCGHQWTAHEEKSTDVNIAVSMVVDAFEDRYDRAMLVTRDSDLAPAVRIVSAKFPAKKVVVVSPPCLRHSGELVNALPSAHRSRLLKTIKVVHLERCLFPAEVKDATGSIVAARPAKYAPPAP
jgi:uncharacterized LabA/DUF88 family protein